MKLYQDLTPHIYTLRTYDFASASRKVSLVNKMAEQPDTVQWLDGEAKILSVVEKICPKRHIRQNQWQSQWNKMYLKERSEHCYDYISDYECIFSHPIYPESCFEHLTHRDALYLDFKQRGTKIPITNLAHFTSFESAKAIIEFGGFLGGEKKINEDAQGDDIMAKFSWWSPLFTEGDILEVRDNLGIALECFIEPPRDNLPTIKSQFATSDAFRPNPHRYGDYYFKYNINDLCYHYESHFKGAVRFKILGTFGYKQEVMHAVLVCSQANAFGMFREYPEVPLPEEFCNKAVLTMMPNDPQCIWRPQATGTEITRLDRYRQPYPRYRRWEHVAFAFHIPDEWEENGKLMSIPELDHNLHNLLVQTEAH